MGYCNLKQEWHGSFWKANLLGRQIQNMDSVLQLKSCLFCMCVCACYLETAVLPSPRQHLQQRRSKLVQAQKVREHHTMHSCQLAPTCAHIYTHDQKGLQWQPVDNSMYKVSHLLIHKPHCCHVKTPIIGQNKQHADLAFLTSLITNKYASSSEDQEYLQESSLEFWSTVTKVS